MSTPPGTLFGGEATPPGTLFGGEATPPGTLFGTKYYTLLLQVPCFR